MSKTINADFNYGVLNDLDANISMKSLNGSFNPVIGKFIVYKFLATFAEWDSFEEKNKEYHDILIIKADNHNKIIDAYQYTLEWAEPPFCYDLYKYTAKNAVLNDKLSIDQLTLARTCYSDKKENAELLNEKGIIRLTIK